MSWSPFDGHQKPAQKSLWRDMKLEGIHRLPKTPTQYRWPAARKIVKSYKLGKKTLATQIGQ